MYSAMVVLNISSLDDIEEMADDLLDEFIEVVHRFDMEVDSGYVEYDQ